MSNVTKENVLFCPQCQGAAIEASALAGGPASCKACNWSGQREDLLVHEIKHQFAGGDEVLRFFARDLQLTVVSALAEPLGRLLLKWGFIEQGKLDSKVLSRYLKAAARGLSAELLKERELIELENAAIEKAQKGPANDAS